MQEALAMIQDAKRGWLKVALPNADPVRARISQTAINLLARMMGLILIRWPFRWWRRVSRGCSPAWDEKEKGPGRKAGPGRGQIDRNGGF